MTKWEEWGQRWKVRMGNEVQSGARPQVAALILASMRMGESERIQAEQRLVFMRCRVIRDACDDERSGHLKVVFMRPALSTLVTIDEVMEWLTGHALSIERAQAIHRDDDGKAGSVAHVWARDVLDISGEHAVELYALARNEVERMRAFVGQRAWSEALVIAHDAEGEEER